MLVSGIFTGYFPYDLEETAKKIREHGFNTVQLDLHFKDVDLGPGNITTANAKQENRWCFRVTPRMRCQLADFSENRLQFVKTCRLGITL